MKNSKYKHLISLESFFESYTSLKKEEKSILDKAVDELKKNSSDMSVGNSEVANPKGIAKNPFYDTGARALDGNGESYAKIVPGSIKKDGDVITAQAEHGVVYNTNKTTKSVSKIIIDLKEGTFSFDKESTSL